MLIIDDIQHSWHIEMTLRKVGFDVEAINSEFSMPESILSFNPDYIICRGIRNRLSALNVGRKLKEASSKYDGVVILIFPEGFKIAAVDLLKLKMDLFLFDPISTLRLVVHLLSFSKHNFEFIRDKLLKFAITDIEFRNFEQQILKNAGITIDSEIQIISGMDYAPPPSRRIINEADSIAPIESQQTVKAEDGKSEDERSSPIILNASRESGTDAAGFGASQPTDLSIETLQKINQEIQTVEQELPLRIDTYSHTLKKVHLESSLGLKKWQTKKAVKQLRKDLIKEQKTDSKSEQVLDDEKVRFAQALFRKK